MKLFFLMICLMVLADCAHAKVAGPSIGKSKPDQPIQNVQRRLSAVQQLINVISKNPIDIIIDLANKTEAETSAATTTATIAVPSKTQSNSPINRTKATTFFNEYAPKGGKSQPPVIDDAEAAKRSEHRNPPGGGAGGKTSGIPQKFDRMWPVCFFIDSSLRIGNQIVKEVTDMAARCKVNLVAFPFFIKSNYPKGINALKAAAKRSCNAIAGMNKLGVARASVAMLVNSSSAIKSYLNNPEANSCAEVGFAVPPGQKARMEATGTWCGEAKSGEPAAAIIGPGGLTGANVAGRLQGQGQMAMPWGSGSGNGTGDYGEGYATAGSLPENGWSESGCDAMRKSAFPNTGNFKYLPSQTNYVQLGKNLWDIKGGRPVFNVQAASSTTPPPVANHPGRAEASSPNSSANSQGATPSESSVISDAIVPATGHKFGTPATAVNSAASETPSQTITEAKILPKAPTKVPIGGQLDSLDDSFMATKVEAKPSSNDIKPEPRNPAAEKSQKGKGPGSDRRIPGSSLR